MSFRVPNDSSSDESEPTTLALPPLPTIMSSEAKKLPWPKWNREVEDYPFFHKQLECRIKGTTDLTDEMICYRMIQILPDKKQKLVASWFNIGGKDKDWAWEKFLNHFALQFEGKQAKKAVCAELS